MNLSPFIKNDLLRGILSKFQEIYHNNTTLTSESVLLGKTGNFLLVKVQKLNEKTYQIQFKEAKCLSIQNSKLFWYEVAYGKIEDPLYLKPPACWKN